MASTLSKAKIFISSVNEDGLRPLRGNVFGQLADLGHEPVMWERNLGPWPANENPVVRCLEAVEASDIYLLFVGTRAGTYYPEARRTVTHLECIKAFDTGKLILVFADVRVKSTFFSAAKPFLERFMEQQLGEAKRHPTPEETMAALRQCDGLPADVDPYVWFLLYDLTVRGVYIDDLSLGVPVDWKTYFSDLLRRGAMLLPLQRSFAESASRLEQYDDAVGSLFDMLRHLDVAGIRSPELFMKSIMKPLSGGVVLHRYGDFMSETIGTYVPCAAGTLYARSDDKMHFVAKVGDAQGKLYYKLNDRSSYIALTYQMGNDAAAVYYTEAKQMFYCCIRSGEFVLTLHFPAGPGWDNQRFMHYQDSVNNAIINKNPLLIEMIRTLLGGMQP